MDSSLTGYSRDEMICRQVKLPRSHDAHYERIMKWKEIARDAESRE
jgi:hypothetical protein